jgi:hypothetical protein
LLGSAKTGGNVEAVILREYDNHDISDLLLNGISTRRVNAKTLSWNPATNVERMPSKGLTIIDAHLKGTQINIVMQTTLPHGELLYRVVAECAGQRCEVSISAKPDSGGLILLQVPAKHAFIQTEDPLSVTVQVQGNGPMARSWVAVPFALAFTAAQRGVQSSARQMCRRVFEDGDAASVVADAIANFLGELANLTEQPGTAVVGGRSAEQRKEPDRPISANDFIVSTEELGNLRETTARTAQAFYGLAALLEKILIVADTDDEDMPADSIDVEAAEEKPERQLEDRNEQSRKRDRVKAEDQLSQLTEAFRLTVREALHKEVSPAAVPFVLNLPDAVISFLLLHARIRQRLNLEPDRRLTYAFRDILQDVLSIDGILIGTSFGWLVRAKFSDRCQTTLQELLNDRGRVSRLFAFIAAGLVMAGPKSPDLAQAVLGGLHFVTGEMPARQIDEEIQTQLGRVAAASGGWISVADMEKVLQAYAPGQLSALLLAQRWSAKPADSFCRAIERNSIVSCSRSHMTFPANTSVMLKSANGDVRCPFCRRVILPVKTGSIVSGVLHWFDSVLAGTQ